MDRWFYRRLIWNGVFIFGSLLMFNNEICEWGQNIILTLLCVCLIMVLLIDFIPSVLKKDKVSNQFYLLPKNERLLYITKNIDMIIVRVYFVILGVVVLNYLLYDNIPVLLGYVYWMLFGSYFSIKIVRYSDFYIRKYDN